MHKLFIATSCTYAHMYVCALTLYRSYTGFAYSGLKVPEKLSTKDNLNVTVSVTNTGVYGGDEVRIYRMYVAIDSEFLPTLCTYQPQRPGAIAGKLYREGLMVFVSMSS